MILDPYFILFWHQIPRLGCQNSIAMSPPTIMQFGRSTCAFRKAKCNGLSLRYTSTSASISKIPPESPKFIEIPQPPQRFARPKESIKGVLPVPRKIFPRGAPNKTTPEYLSAVTPEPSVRKNFKTVSRETKELELWKARQSATRRQNLRDGLVGLHQRKQTTDRKLAARSQFKQAEHLRKVHAPERTDERLTRPSVLQFMNERTHTLPDPHRKERIAMKKEKVMMKEDEKRDQRQNALHTLYMNAREFIVTEEDLNKKVDEVFDDKWFQVNEGFSIWDKVGYPEGIANRLHALNKDPKEKSAIDYNSGYAQITRERVQRIAEELTGGKM